MMHVGYVRNLTLKSFVVQAPRLLDEAKFHADRKCKQQDAQKEIIKKH